MGTGGPYGTGPPGVMTLIASLSGSSVASCCSISSDSSATFCSRSLPMAALLRRVDRGVVALDDRCGLLGVRVGHRVVGEDVRGDRGVDRSGEIRVDEAHRLA